MAAITPTGGTSLNSVPSPKRVSLSTNYLDFTGGDNDWSQQYLPDLIEQEAEVYGKRTIAGLLAAIGAEESMASDQVIWTEQGRLHASYDVESYSSEVLTLDAAIGTSSTDQNSAAIKPGNTVLISDGAANPFVFRAYVSAVSAVSSTVGTNATITIRPYKYANVQGAVDAGASTTYGNWKVFVYGSEFNKGTSGMGEGTNADAVEPSFASFSNKPIILKDHYQISGSDTSRIGWVEVSAEDGTSGYLWYLKAEAETRLRFNDQLEMALVEAEKGADSSAAEGSSGLNKGNIGTEGLFSAITARGHVTSGIAGTSASDDLGSFDQILKKFDEQGAIEEYMLYCNRDVSLAIDDMLASQNSYGAGGTSYGVFSNSEEMALNLGFAGFRRASYDFYKSDWKYLNDATLRGQAAFRNDVRGVLIPAGTSTVYDDVVGRSMRRPFLHVRYRASQMDDRRMKTWITGSVGGNITSHLDAMEINFLSERCLVVQGANNFMLLN